MLKHAAIAVAMACLLGGAAYAADDEEPDNACTQQLAKAEELVQNKIDANAINDADVDKVNELLDEADSLCSEGKVDEATATLATVNKMVGK